MPESYLGRLEHSDPLYGYLADDVLPRLDSGVADPVFHVARLSGTNLVYKYAEERTGRAVIGKFYRFDRPDKAAKLEAEYANLSLARTLGFTSPPMDVVRPVGRETGIGLGVLIDYVDGRDLDHYIRRAIFEGRAARLYAKLGCLAGFLVELHKRTATPVRLDLDHPADYFDRVVVKLSEKKVVDVDEALRLLRLRDGWMEREIMAADRFVMLHGDATPTNFIFPGGRGVVAIDLERMRPGDRMYDVGMVAGELKHAFLMHTGDRYASEPFIGYFLREYARRAGGGERTYRAVVRRNPFFMALTELRIARNSWLPYIYRRRLVREAVRCLTHGLRRYG